ncbi:hypothetical protein BKM15_25970 [Pseudomonas syringae pv. syringae]|nr:hypothetical protein BKM15_25970 [Pseudomonas syringae pv. syringae]
MATIKELQARFTAQVSGFRTTMRAAAKEIKSFGNDSQRSVEGTNQSFRSLQKEADKAGREIKDVGDDVSRSMNKVERAVERADDELKELGANTKLKDLRDDIDEANDGLIDLNDNTRESGGWFGKLRNSVMNVTVSLKALQYSLVGLSPAGIPAVAALTTATMGLASSLAAAGIGAVAFGAVAASALTKVFEASEEVAKLEEKIANADSAKERLAAQKELAAVYAGMSTAQRGALQDLQSFKTFWAGFVKQFENPIFEAFSQGLQATKGLLKGLEPTIKSVSTVVVDLMTELNKDISNGGMKGFFDWLSTNAANSLYNFAKVGGNVMSGFFSLLQAFTPIGSSMEKGLVSLTEKFKNWAAGLSSNTAFQNFIEYAKTNGPVLIDTLKNIGKFIGNVVVALAPLGEAILNAAKGISNFLANSETAKSFFGFLSKVGTTIRDNWAPIAAVIAGAAAAVGTFKLIMTGMTIVGTINKLMTAWRAGTLAQYGLNTALLANPIGIIIAALVGLGVALVVAYKKSETFRNIVNAVWQSLKTGFKFVIDWFAKTIPIWVANIVKWFTSMKDRGSVVIGSMVRAVTQHINNMRQYVSGIMKIIKGIFTGDFDLIKKGVAQAASALYNNLKMWLGKMGINIDGSVAKIKNFFVNGFTNMKNRAGEILTSMGKTIAGKFNDIVTAAKNLPGRIGQGISSMAGKVTAGIKALANKMMSNLGLGVNGVITGINWVLQKVGVDKKVPKWEVPQYQRGTEGHPGGLAILGDGKKKELYVTPDGQIGLSPAKDTLMNLPAGTKVFSGQETKQLADSGIIPAYKNGIGKAMDWIREKGGQVKDKALDVWENISNPKLLFKKTLAKFGVETPSFPGVLKDFGKGAFNKIKEAFQTFLSNKLKDIGSMGGSFKGGVAAPAQVRAWVMQALNMTNTPLSWLPAMLVKAQKESGFNPRAINLWDINAKRGTPSKGLFQTIDPTFNAYKMPGMNDIYNPIHNAVAAIRYIKSRYGTVFNTPGIKSMARGGSYKGYFEGARVAFKQLAWVAEKGAEYIIPTDGGQRAYELWAQAGAENGFTAEQGTNTPTNTQYSRTTQPVVLQVNLNSRTLAQETVDDITELQELKKGRVNRAKGRVNI